MPPIGHQTLSMQTVWKQLSVQLYQKWGLKMFCHAHTFEKQREKELKKFRHKENELPSSTPTVRLQQFPGSPLGNEMKNLKPHHAKSPSEAKNCGDIPQWYARVPPNAAGRFQS